MGRIPAYLLTGEYRKTQLKRLTPRHEIICELLSEGRLVKDVARAVGVSRWTVTLVANCPLGQKRVREFLKRRIDPAILRYADMLNESVRNSRKRQTTGQDEGVRTD